MTLATPDAHYSGLRIGLEADRAPSDRGLVSRRWRVQRGLAAGHRLEQVPQPLFGMRSVAGDWKVEFLAPRWGGPRGRVGLPRQGVLR